MDIRYPIGKFQQEGAFSTEQIQQWIEDIQQLPSRLTAAVEGLSSNQLDTPYRPDGWTVRQLVHHIADSHLNAYIRFKLAITEHEPTIKPYDEKKWAELNDSSLPIEISLDLLEVLHQRWVVLLRSLSFDDLNRKYNHPDTGLHSISTMIGLYSWHGRHHTAHITSLRDRMGWQ